MTATHNGHDLDLPAYIVHARETAQPPRSFRQIENDLWEVFKVKKDHTTVKRIYEHATRGATVATLDATPRNTGETAETETTENVNNDTENSVSGVAKQAVSVQFLTEFGRTFHPADLVFYSTVAIGGLGVAQALNGVGVAVSILWFCIAAIFLHRLKMFARWGDAAVLAMIELAVGIPAHYTWATNSLWANIKHLPLTVYVEKYQNGAGEWVAFYTGKDVEMPFYIACYVAAILAVFGACAVAASVLANKKNELQK